MLLLALFTFTVGPMLHVDLLSHFSHIWSGKNKEQRLICFLFRIYMQKLICRTDLLCDQPIFVAQFGRRRCAWLSKIFRANDHCSGLISVVNPARKLLSLNTSKNYETRKKKLNRLTILVS